MSKLCPFGNPTEPSDGTVIVAEGATPDAFYIVEDGVVAVKVRKDEEDLELTRLGNDAYFGEKGLLDGTPRSASVKLSISFLA